MKILYISEVMPYKSVAHAGGKVFYNQLLHSSKHVSCDILCYYDKNEEKHKKDLDELCDKVVLVERGSLKDNKIKNIFFQIKKFTKALFVPYISLGYPVNMNLFKNELKKLLKNNNYDIIELTFTSSLAYLPLIKKLAPNAKINIVEHDVSFLNLKRSFEYEKGLFSRALKYLRYRVYKYSEVSLLKKCDLITVLNDKDRRLLNLEGFSNDKIYTVVPYFERPSKAPIYTKESRIKNSILFYGAMWRKENDESIYNFLVNIFPYILQKKPDAKLYIVGNRPTDRVLTYNDNKNVFVTGFVEDASEYFNKCEIFIVPLLLGAGIKIKTLEALSYGMPTVTTHIGLEGIDADKQNACILTDIENFGDEVVKLLSNDDMKKRLSESALKFINEKYDYESSIKGLLERYKVEIEK